MKLKCKKEKLCPVRIESRPSLVASMHGTRPNHYTFKLNTVQFAVFDKKGSLLHFIKSWDNSQAEPVTMPRLNLGNIPAIAGNSKLEQFPDIDRKNRAIAGI